MAKPLVSIRFLIQYSNNYPPILLFMTSYSTFFLYCYKNQQIPTSWKISLTILFYKKGNPSQLSNHRPIALANTIYKLFTSTFTSLFSSYGEKHHILHFNHKGFWQEWCTSRQLQLIIGASKDANLIIKTLTSSILIFKMYLALLITPVY
jgi:hypothetical protein